jgi:hypothetical protein
MEVQNSRLSRHHLDRVSLVWAKNGGGNGKRGAVRAKNAGHLRDRLFLNCKMVPRLGFQDVDAEPLAHPDPGDGEDAAEADGEERAGLGHRG